jgi:multiple sugar transport system permease protein
VRGGGTRAEARAAFLFLAPALGGIGLFFMVPVLAVLLLSFTDFDIYGLADPANTRFMGLNNYLTLLRSDLFWKALANTLIYALVGGPLTIAMALAAALLVDSKLARFKGLFRTIYFAPVVTTLVAVAVVWRYLYHPRFGLLNRVLDWVGIGPIDWLGDPRWALPAMILLAVWKNFGYSMILIIGGLQTIPPQLYESARIDGAGWWREFRHITLPMLGPTFLLVGVITAVGYFQIFAEPYVMTRGGGPLNATLSVVLFMYKEGFRWWNMGFAAAVALVLFLVILLFTTLHFRLQKGVGE